MGTQELATPPLPRGRARRVWLGLAPWLVAGATSWVAWYHHEPEWVQSGGLLLVTLAAAVVWALARTRHRALALAERMTWKLRASEAHVRAVLGAVPDGILALDSEGRVRSFSLGAEGVFGCQAEQAEGRPVAELVPALASLETGRLETGARHADGRETPVEVAVTEMHDGRRRGYVVVVRDISARRRQERERAAQHAVTRALAESVTPDDALPRVLEALGTELGFDFGAAWLVERGSGLLRPAGCWVALPGTCERLVVETQALALPPGRDLPGRVWENGGPVWVGDLAAAGTGLVRHAAARAGGMRRAQACPITLGAEVLGVLEFFGHELAPPSASQLELLAGVASQLAQFLERAAADRSRRAADERARSVVDSMLEGLVVSDAQGRIEEVNPASERIFGYGAWELFGQPVAALFEHELSSAPARFAAEAWLPSLGGVREWRARRKTGATFPASVALVEFHTADGRRLLAAHLRDLSEERQAERTKKEFVATVSHELRTPLTSIRGGLSLLASGALGDLPDEARDVVEIAERNTGRLAALIDDILDLERLEAGKLEMSFETVHLAEVVARAIESVSGLARAAGVALEADPGDCRVHGDADRLVQVLVNLLANAAKFSPAGSSVRVGCRAAGDFAEVRVTDRGRGIPLEAQARIFERFQQVEASDAREKGGTGLGLAICRAIVAQHGGRLGVESELGRGSTFWFQVPLAERCQGREDGLLRALGAGAGAGPDVLLVDPDGELSAVVARQMLQVGLPVRAARDVAAANSAISLQWPAVVVLDPALAGARQLSSALLRDPDAPALVLYTSAAEGPAETRRSVGAPRDTPVLTRSREAGAQLVEVVRRLHAGVLRAAREVPS